MDVMRRWLMALLVLGLCGLAIELVLFEHYEDVWQFVPFGLIGFAFVAIAWQSIRPTEGSVRVFQVAMLMLVLGGIVGLAMHYQGNVEFQREVDPSLQGWALFVKAVHAKTPPALAPGAMSQLGLLGLIYAHRHPALPGRQEIYEHA